MSGWRIAGLALAALLTSTALPVPAQPAPGQPAPDQRAIDEAMRRGVTMFWYDRAAWVTTDDLVAKVSADRLRDLGGWVVTPRDDGGYHVDYIGQGEAADRVIYAADVTGRDVRNAIVHPKGTEPRLTGMAAAMALALVTARGEMARHADWRPCTPAMFNTIVLPPGRDGTTSVYFLSAQTDTGRYPFGGHYKVDVAADGRIVGARGFTNSCITLAKGGKPAALVVTHLLDPQPTEVHVFQQFALGVPLMVGIVPGNDLWRVENGRITHVDLGKRAPSKVSARRPAPSVAG
ncbi:hypothetical protein PQ455_02310 [Sphingomonas naphthae]|uniref:Uncharacterized protein n=1 Tax=Sphingomonas naphthae TaxID=1813468 RepID=A0ABY7TMA2_9SPHN|nr:hypothetical protein [Sphingomonas naphthae]WCT74085.1 hypothetical protein PQ455_02310 [Sphingomonas naphthae]